MHVYHKQKQDIPASGVHSVMLSLLGKGSILSSSP